MSSNTVQMHNEHKATPRPNSRETSNDSGTKPKEESTSTSEENGNITDQTINMNGLPTLLFGILGEK